MTVQTRKSFKMQQKVGFCCSGTLPTRREGITPPPTLNFLEFPMQSARRMPGGAASPGQGLTARAGDAREVQALPQSGRASSDPKSKLSHTSRSPTPKGTPPRRSEHRPPTGIVPLECAAQHTDRGGTPPPQPRKQQVCTLSRPRSPDPRVTKGAPPLHPPMSPIARSPRSGRGAPDFLDSFCLSETERPPGPRRLARHSLHRAPRFPRVPGGLAGARG